MSSESFSNAIVDEPLVTPANMMTAARPLLGFAAALKLARNKEGAFKLFVYAGMTDAEGFVARATDKLFPNTGRGSTKIGKPLDFTADSVLFAEMALGTVLSQRVTTNAKFGVLGVLSHEFIKAKWAKHAHDDYERRTGEPLVITPSLIGKTATCFKILSLGAAALTSEQLPAEKRRLYSDIAVQAAIAGFSLGELARQSYDCKLEEDAYIQLRESADQKLA